MGQAKKQTQMTGGDYFMSANGGTMLRRIRSPHAHDVLCGRGGGINSHVGNRVFRDWVAERRLDYNLASTKADKARVAKEVMNRVTIQDPPGRFLQRDPTSGIGSWWIEVSEEKAMAKTSQALREGAPTIRAQHQHPEDSPTSRTLNHRTRSRDDTPNSPLSSLSPVTFPLMTNADFQKEFYRPAKMAKIDPDDTPTLLPTPGAEIPALTLDAPGYAVVSPTVGSLVTSTDSFRESTWSLDSGHLDDFVNPFENEETALELYEKSLLPDNVYDSCPTNII